MSIDGVLLTSALCKQSRAVLGRRQLLERDIICGECGKEATLDAADCAEALRAVEAKIEATRRRIAAAMSKPENIGVLRQQKETEPAPEQAKRSVQNGAVNEDLQHDRASSGCVFHRLGEAAPTANVR